MMSRLKNKKGFTLIELVVVVSIIAILVAIALPRFVNARRSANTAKIAADLRTIDSAIILFYTNNSRYPTQAPNIALSDLATENKYFATIPRPPNGEFYWSKDIGGAAKVTTGEDFYTISVPNGYADLSSSRVTRGTYLVSGGGSQLYSFENFTGFSRISNKPVS